MFREMRRKRQALSEEECVQLLNAGTSGVLAVLGDDGYPYAVPLSYLYDDGCLYFHSAKIGHKLDAIQQHDKVSFCVIDQDQIMAEEYTTYYRSVIVFGKISVLTKEQEKRFAFEKLADRYSPNDASGIHKEINIQFQQVCILKLCIEHMSGKEAIELVQK